MKLYHTDFLVELRVVVRDGDAPAEVTLRKALKTLLRAYGIQCRAVAPGLPQDERSSAPPAPDPPAAAPAGPAGGRDR
jgi:hypothetical protein